MLGRGPLPSLPAFTSAVEFRFGRATEYGDTVANAMHPLTAVLTAEEAAQVHRKYVLSHKAYSPGEHRRHYEDNWTAPEKNLGSGIENQLEGDGGRTKETLYWDDERVTYLN